MYEKETFQVDSLCICSHEGEDVPRDSRLSKSTESTAQVANNELPPPPYQEVALTVDEAVAKAVSTADSKESKDAGSSETRDVSDVRCPKSLKAYNRGAYRDDIICIDCTILRARSSSLTESTLGCVLFRHDTGTRYA